MNLTLVGCVALASLPLGGCSKIRSLLGGKGEAAKPAASASAQASAAPTPAAQSGVCKVVQRKVWGSGANARTGITVTRLSDGSFAVGVAMGNRPEIVAFDRAGEGKLVQPVVAGANPLAHGVPAAQGRRDLQRVTPAVAAKGVLVAYADYRDVYKNKRRRIACGRTDTSKALLVFDGKPLLDRSDEDSDKTPPGGRVAHAGVIPEPAPSASAPASAKQPAAKKPVAVRGRLALPGILRQHIARKPGAKPAQPAKPATPAKPAAVVGRPSATVKKPAKPGKPERELRDCRSFVDPAGHDAWAVGSELYAKPESDGSTHYSMRFFVAPGGGRANVLLKTIKLADNPDKLYTFEAPVAEKLPDGSYALAARYRGSLYAWTLGPDKRQRGPARVYGGGYLTMPHMLRDGDDLLILLSQSADNDHWSAQVARLSGRGGTLPAKLTALGIDTDPSQAEPTFAVAAGQRWIAYQSGDRLHGQMVVVPVDASLAVAGRPFRVTPSGEDVDESHLFGLGTGKLLAVYLERAPSPRLVSEVLDCHLAK